VHGFGPWGNARNGLNGDQRGFTGHEHLAELGIIHMNGRLYDAVIGRFLQADPIIQAPQNGQSHNRYSYVLNNPLSFTDPSGFSSWTKWRGTVLSIAAMALMQFYLAPMIAANISFALLDAGVALGSEYAIGTAVGAASSGFAAGWNLDIL
jgi:RHS repeat-associated protein